MPRAARFASAELSDRSPATDRLPDIHGRWRSARCRWLLSEAILTNGHRPPGSRRTQPSFEEATVQIIYRPYKIIQFMNLF